MYRGRGVKIPFFAAAAGYVSIFYLRNRSFIRIMRKILASIACLMVMTALGERAFGQDISGDAPVKAIAIPRPVYPAEAKATGLVGRLAVNVNIDEKGTVSLTKDPVVGPDFVCPGIDSPDVVALRKAVSDAALKATFTPAMKDGKPKATTRWLSYNFGTPKAPDAANAGATVKTISGGVLNGKARKLPKPEYPAAARSERVSGAVSIQILVLEDGTVFSAEPVSGHELLVNDSRLAACSASFPPTQFAGAPVKVSGVITYNFVP
jgi:outer membrane biosynthesis protein TonB